MNTKLEKIRKRKGRGTKEPEKEWPVREERSQRVGVWKSQETNVSERKEWSPVSSAAGRACKVRLKSDHWPWQLPRAVSVELFSQKPVNRGLENK